ncbi:uncharacterized protein [Montipora capricornis]|uniref:uncharacterized protein n=1 Tax=Montipora capricornis TaxID=246305 RepID=UPI0035F152F5
MPSVEQVEIKLLLTSVASHRHGKPNLILGISESFLDDSWSSAALAVDNYNLFREDRRTGAGGGLLIYVPSHLPVKRRSDLEIEGVETIWLELQFPRSKSRLFVLFTDIPPQMLLLRVFWKKCYLTQTAKTYLVVLGDLNFDLLEMSRPSATKNYLNISQTPGFEQLITKATRPILNSPLDHIFVSQKDFVTVPGTLPLSLSDRLPIFVSLNSRSNIFKQPRHKTLHIRSRKSLSIDAFIDDLSCAPWNTLEVFNDPSEAIEQWYLLFNDVLDTHAPVKSRCVKRPRPPDWFSAEIGVTIKERNRLHKLASAHNNSSNWDAYRHARNKVVHMIRSAKRVFYRNAIKSNLDNPKNLWRIIRNISPAKCSNLPGYLSVNGHIVSDNTEIANQFNDHFANITSSVDHGDDPLYPNWDYISEFVASKLPSSAPLFIIPPISEQDVESSLSRLKSNKAVGLDGVDG